MEGRLHALHDRLWNDSITAYLEPSRRGGHLWLFLAEPLSGRTVRAFARALVKDQPAVEIWNSPGLLALAHI